MDLDQAHSLLTNRTVPNRNSNFNVRTFCFLSVLVLNVVIENCSENQELGMSELQMSIVLLICHCFCSKQFLNSLNAENGYPSSWVFWVFDGFCFSFVFWQEAYRQRLQDQLTLDSDGNPFKMLVFRGSPKSNRKSLRCVDEMRRSDEFDSNIKHTHLRSLPKVLESSVIYCLVVNVCTLQKEIDY